MQGWTATVRFSEREQEKKEGVGKCGSGEQYEKSINPELKAGINPQIKFEGSKTS